MEEVYPAVPGTFLEHVPKDVRKELGKFRQACLYRVRLQSLPQAVIITIESYNNGANNYIGWPTLPAYAGSIANLLNLITTMTTGNSTMHSNMILRHLATPPYLGTIHVYDPTGTFAVGGFAVCGEFVNALRDAYAILSAL